MNNNRYATLRSKSEEERDKETLGFEVEEAQHQIEGDITQTKRSLAEAKRKLVEAESRFPFDSNAVVQAELDVEGFEAGLKRLTAIKERLFDASETSES